MNLHKNTGTGSDTPPPRQEEMSRESDDARWLREMVTDYRLDADNTVTSRRIAINELIHSQRETITLLRNTVTAAQEKTKKAQAELHETWIDERGTVWTRPTAWAYAQVCRVKDEQKETITRLEDRLEESRFKFCPYCGKPIEQLKQEAP